MNEILSRREKKIEFVKTYAEELDSYVYDKKMIEGLLGGKRNKLFIFLDEVAKPAIGVKGKYGHGRLFQTLRLHYFRLKRSHEKATF